MIRRCRRNSFLNFMLPFGFIWFLVLMIFSTWTFPNSRRGTDDVKLKKSRLSEAQKFVEIIPSFDDFEDDFAEMPKKTSMKPKRRKQKKLKNDFSLDPPEISPEILELQRRLNLTNPGS